MSSARLRAARSPTSLLNSSCLSLETDLYGRTCPFSKRTRSCAATCASVRALTVTPKLLPDHLGYHVHLPRAGLKATLFRAPLEPAPHGTDDLEGEPGSSPLGPRVEPALQSAVAHPQQPVADSRVGGFQIPGYPAYAVALLPAQACQEPELCALVLPPSCRFFQPLLAGARHERGAGLPAARIRLLGCSHNRFLASQNGVNLPGSVSFEFGSGRSGLRRSVWVTGLQHYRNLQFFWPGDRIIVATTRGDNDSVNRQPVFLTYDCGKENL